MSSPTTVAVPPTWRITERRAASKVSETSSSSSQPMIERRPDHSRAPPPSSQKQRAVRGRDLLEELQRAGHGLPQEVRDQVGAVLGQDRLGVELHALERQRPVPDPHHHALVVDVAGPGRRLEHVGQPDRRERVVADGGEALRHAGEDAPAVVLDPGHLAVRRRVPVDRSAVRRDEALHAEADAEHRHRAVGEHLAADREVGGDVGVAGPGREHDVGVPEQVLEGGLVVLDDRRQPAGHGGDEVHEVPRVGVVVVHDHDVRGGGHRLNVVQHG